MTHSLVRVEGLAPDVGPAMGAFARALREGVTSPFLPAIPHDDRAWMAWLDEVAARKVKLPAEVGARIVERQRALGAGPRAIAAAEALAEGRALCVVTGQQPGLFGGPLLTLHKAAGALHLARRLDALGADAPGGHPVVAVFWLASEDHDLDEANRALVRDRQGEPTVLRIDAAPDGRSLAHVALADAPQDAAWQALVDALPDSDRGQLASALATREPGEPFASWCARCLVRILGDSGLVVLDPFDLLPAAGDTLADLVLRADVIEDAVRKTGVALRAAGLPAPLDPPPGHIPVFLRETPEGPRLRVARAEDGSLLVRDEPTSLTAASLAELLRREPLRGSGNVIGRVFVQNRHLPVIGYVAGPSEIAYQAQVCAAAQALGEPFPLALPRPEATWVDAKTAGRIEAFGAALADVLRAGVVMPDVDDDAGDALVAAFANHLHTLPDHVVAALASKGRGPDALRRAIERLQAAWAKQSAKIAQAFAADAGLGRDRWVQVQHALRPRGKPQERVLSPLSLIARHGVEAVRAGLEALDPLAPVHHVVRLDVDASTGGTGAAQEQSPNE